MAQIAKLTGGPILENYDTIAQHWLREFMPFSKLCVNHIDLVLDALNLVTFNIA